MIKYIKLLIITTFLFCYTINAETNEEFTAKLKKCAACHTMTGNSISPAWPKIAEQHSDYLYKQLIEYKKGKDGNRYDPTMLGMLQNIDENDMKNLSNYFSQQVLEKSKLKIDKNEFDLGKKLYLYGDKTNNIIACVGCHGINGNGNKLANFPSLKWQHKEYIAIQLKKFKTHERSNDPKEIMRDIVANMSNEQMNALATYISSIN